MLATSTGNFVNNHHRQSVTSTNLWGSTAPAPQKLGEQPRADPAPPVPTPLHVHYYAQSAIFQFVCRINVDPLSFSALSSV